MDSELVAILDFAKRTATDAGRVLMKRFGTAQIEEKESTQNLVTQADHESEQLIADCIAAQFSNPTHEIMGEETEFHGSIVAEHLWVVDPLDATNNYAHGIPHFCVSIAYARRGQVLVGAVLDPVRQEMFTAIRGAGAWLNDRPIRVSQPSGLTRSIIATGFYYDRGLTMQQTLNSIEQLFAANIRGLRRMGAAALDLTWTACGRFQGYFEYQLAPWDYAAGALILEEAGGVCRDRHGQPWDLESCSMIAACDTVADALTAIVALDARDDR